MRKFRVEIHIDLFEVTENKEKLVQANHLMSQGLWPYQIVLTMQSMTTEGMLKVATFLQDNFEEFMK